MKKIIAGLMVTMFVVSNAFAYDPLDSGGEIQLYQAYNYLTGTGYTNNSSLNYLQLNPDTYFVNDNGHIIPVSVGSGYNNALYTYDKGNLAGATYLYSSQGSQYLGDGSVSNPFSDYNINNTNPFGLAVITGDNKTYSSDGSANLLGLDHFVAYQAPSLIGKTYTVNNNGNIETYTLRNPYLVGYEDLAGGGDQDYNDGIFIMDAATPYDPTTSLQNQVTNINNQQNTWNTNQDNSINTLNNNINNVSNVQTIWNQNQDVAINNLDTVSNIHTEQITNINNVNANQDREIASTNSRVDDVSNRVGQLEKPQFLLGGVVRLHDSRKWQVNAFIDYSATRSAVAFYGVRVTYKMGKSYEETRLDEIEHKLNRVLKENDRLEREANAVPYVTSNGMGIRSKF